MTTALYHKHSTKESCTKMEVKEWLQKSRRGEKINEKVSRGWESSHLLVVFMYRDGLENLVMRTVRFCAVVKQK